MAFSSPLRALSSRNYRLYFTGQIISLLGTWMTQTATLWLVYQISSSAFYLGLVGFVSQAPSFFLGPIAGTWVDRVNRHRLLIVTQVLSMAQSFALAAFAFAHQIDVPHLLILGALQGVINAFDMPARQALVVEFVEDREHLGNAIALNSTSFNVARLGGPALAGLLIAAVGPAWCYLIDGLSFVAVIVCLLLMRFPPRQVVPHTGNALADLRDGLRYAGSHPVIRALIVLIMVVSFFGFSFSVLVPIFARDIFHGDARTLGFLMSASGCGALTAALYLSVRDGAKGLSKSIVTGGLLLGVGLILFSLAHVLWLALPCMYAVGLGGVLLMASSNTVIQTVVDNQMRGRVMALFTMAFTGTAPLSNLAMGWFAQRVGGATVLAFTGSICVLAAWLFHRRLPSIRAAVARLSETSKPILAPEPSEAGTV
jgi:MFS family permease